MKRRALVPLLAGLVAVNAAAEPRPALGGVSAVRIANYGAPSVLIEKRDEVRAILEELNRLRGPGGGAMPGCRATRRSC